MTFLSMLRAIGRRWYMLVFGLVLAGIAYVLMQRAGGLYVADTQVTFIPPGSGALSLTNDAYRDSVVAFAGAVGRTVDGADAVGPTSVSDAPLWGTGVTRGYQVQLPNAGSQWESSFPYPVLDVQVVGPNPTWTRDTLTHLLDRIDRVAADRQSAVPASKRIVARRAADALAISYIGSTGTTRMLAAAALAVLAVAISSAAAVALERRDLRGARSKPVATITPIHPVLLQQGKPTS